MSPLWDSCTLMSYSASFQATMHPTVLSCTHCKDKIPKFRNKCSQKRNIGVSVPISTFMHLWAIYIFPRSVSLFCWRKYVERSWDYINRSQTHECWNWGWGCAIPRKGIHKRDFRYSALELHCILLSYTLYCTELPCTLLSFTASFFPFFLSYAAPHWAAPEFYSAITHPTELHCTLLSYDAACWATLSHPTEQQCFTLLNYAAPSEQCCTLLSHGALYWATLHLTELRFTY